MNKELFSFLSILIALVVGAFYYTSSVQTPFISALNSIKSSYFNSIEYIENGINKYTYQAKHIEILEEKLKEFEKNHLIMQQMAAELNNLFQENHSTLKADSRVELVRTISYKEFGNLNKIWLEVNDYNASKIYGLTYKEFVAGIVVSNNGKPLGLLNQDMKSSYAVYVGSGLAPGIAHGNNAKHLVVKFIPASFEIKVGDEVITSGLDNIFFEGLKVGKVLSLTKSQGYQNAIVEQYYLANDPNYFHMIKKVR